MKTNRERAEELHRLLKEFRFGHGRPIMPSSEYNRTYRSMIEIALNEAEKRGMMRAVNKALTAITHDGASLTELRKALRMDIETEAEKDH